MGEEGAESAAATPGGADPRVPPEEEGRVKAGMPEVPVPGEETAGGEEGGSAGPPPADALILLSLPSRGASPCWLRPLARMLLMAPVRVASPLPPLLAAVFWLLPPRMEAEPPPLLLVAVVAAPVLLFPL